VNQELEMYGQMIRLKEKELKDTQQKMDETKKVQEQLKELVISQGNMIDVIENNMDSARSNVKEAGKLLDEGVVYHTKANKKKCIIGGIAIICIVVIVLVLAHVI
jgi:t-SNARE complex subunit (syntaxin)